MDFRQLEYFLVIAQEENMTKAAKRLFMSQPPLSYQLKNLEDELGVELFERDARRMKLTSAGKILKAKAEQVIQLMKDTSKELEDYNAGTGGKLAVGIASSLVHTLFGSGILAKYHALYPQVTFELWEGNGPSLVQALFDDTVEVAVVRVPANSKNAEHLGFNLYDFEHFVDREDPMVAVVHKDQDPFPTQSEIELADLAGKPLVLQRRFQSLVSSVCYDAGFEPNLVCVCDDSRNAVLWPENGLGITVTPEDITDWRRYPNLLRKVIKAPHFNTFQIYLWKKGKYMSSVARNFLALSDKWPGE